jgi:type III restriction enzyme
VKNLSKLDPLALPAILDQADPTKPLLVRARLETVATNIDLGTIDINTSDPPLANELVASITNQTMKIAGLTGAFAQLFPHVRTYVARRCYGKEVDLDDRFIRFHLQDPTIKDLISRRLAAAIGQLTVERRDIQFEKPKFKLSETKPFLWRRDLNPEPLYCGHTVFNYVATYNGFERKFGHFLDKAPDVVRFASLGTTMQGDSGTAFRIDYLKSSGAIGFYHPDWVVVQNTPEGEVNWIVETKGRVWEETLNKDEAMRYWCKQVSDATNTKWQYIRVDQGPFEVKNPTAFVDLTTLFLVPELSP